MKASSLFYRVFSVPNKRGHRLFWNLSRLYYCILLKKAIQGNEPTLPPSPNKNSPQLSSVFWWNNKKPMGKSCTFFYNSPQIYTMERDEENKNLFTDCPVRNPLSKLSRLFPAPIEESCWVMGISSFGWQGEEGQLARLSFEARPTILWLQDEFAHATQEMEALAPRCFSFFLPENPRWRVFTNWWGFGARFFEVTPDYEFGIKSISFTVNGCLFVRKGSCMLADEDQFSRTETYSPD